MASLSSLQWCAFLPLNGRHCKPRSDVVATIVLVSSPMSCWQRRLRCTCVDANLAASPSCCHHLRCMNDIANVVRAQPPSSRWCLCQCCHHKGVGAIIALTLLPVSLVSTPLYRRRLCQRCHHKGIVAIIALALSPVLLASTPLYRHHRQHCAGSVAIITQSSHRCLCQEPCAGGIAVVALAVVTGASLLASH